MLIETPRRSMLKLIASIESVRHQIDQTSLRRAVRTQIAPMMSDADLDEMVAGAVIKTFAAGETLFKEGDAADGLHLIRRGSVTISQTIGGKEVVLAYVAAGNYVGEMALLSSEAKRTATVRAAVTARRSCSRRRRSTRCSRRNQTLARRHGSARRWSGWRSNVAARSGARPGQPDQLPDRAGPGRRRPTCC